MEKAGLPAATRDHATFIASFVEHGVGFLEGFLDSERREALLMRVLEQAELEREQGVAELSGTGTASDTGFAPAGAPPAPFQAVSFLPNKGRIFIDLATDARILAMVGAAFGGVPFYLTTASATIVRKGAAGQVIHADQQAWLFTTPVPAMVTLVACLTDFTPDMGSTRFVPGTRENPPPPIGILPETGVVGNLDPLQPEAFSARAGALAMWDGRIWHGQGASTSDVPRVAVIMTFAMHMVRAQDDFLASLHDDVLEGLTEQERQVLGFEVHYQYAGRVAPRFPGDARANTNFRYPYVPELRRGGPVRAIPLADAVIDGRGRSGGS